MDLLINIIEYKAVAYISFLMVKTIKLCQISFDKFFNDHICHGIVAIKPP